MDSTGVCSGARVGRGKNGAESAHLHCTDAERRHAGGSVSTNAASPSHYLGCGLPSQVALTKSTMALPRDASECPAVTEAPAAKRARASDDAADKKAHRVASLVAAVRAAREVAPPVPGLLLVAKLLSRGEETELLRAIDASPWRADLSRRVQHYGWRYNYKERRVSAADRLGRLPDWAVRVAQRLAAIGATAPEPFDQVIVNEYEPGQGIAPHVDQPFAFSDEIVSVSLGSPITMEFREARGGKQKGADGSAPAVRQVRLEPRSAVCLTGAARYDWTHCIPARKSDVVGGQRVPRGRRVSLTFRRLKNDRPAG